MKESEGGEGRATCFTMTSEGSPGSAAINEVNGGAKRFPWVLGAKIGGEGPLSPSGGSLRQSSYGGTRREAVMAAWPSCTR